MGPQLLRFSGWKVPTKIPWRIMTGSGKSKLQHNHANRKGLQTVPQKGGKKWHGWGHSPATSSYMGLSENRVYSQWNSHLIGIMISKTIGFRGTQHFQTNPHETIRMKTQGGTVTCQLYFKLSEGFPIHSWHCDIQLWCFIQLYIYI